MKTISVIVLFLIGLVPIYECASATGPSAKHPDHPDKCYADLGAGQSLFISPGNSKKHPKACIRYSCYDMRGEFYLQYASCGTLAPAHHCWVVKGDPSKPYPGCCNEYTC